MMFSGGIRIKLMPSLDAHHANQEQKGEYAALATWIEAKAFGKLLVWFGCVEAVRVRNASGRCAGYRSVFAGIV